MSTTSNAIVAHSVPANYPRLLEEVKETQYQATNSDKKWFEKTTLRSRVYYYVDASSKSYLKLLKSEMTVARIWRLCAYTAPIALTQIAPEESYKNKENAFFKISLHLGEENIENFPDIKIGIDLFERILEVPLKEDQSLSLLCNLYEGCHSFVVEKRSNVCCVLYQSYLGMRDESNYTFDEFLTDNKKHTEWKPEKLVRSLNKVISEKLPLEKRIRNYQKLFFYPANSCWKEWKRAKHSFIFADTEPYSNLKK